jgi:hypothetical protein
MTITVFVLGIIILVSAVLGGVLFLLAGYYFFYKPRSKELEHLRDKLQASQLESAQKLKQYELDSQLTLNKTLKFKNDRICQLIGFLIANHLGQAMDIQYRGHCPGKNVHYLDFILDSEQLALFKAHRIVLKEMIADIKDQLGLQTNFKVRIFPVQGVQIDEHQRGTRSVEAISIGK